VYHNLSVAETGESAPVISEEVGLHPIGTGEYVPVKVGGLLSVVQLTVRDVVAVLLHASVAVNVLVCEEIQPLTLTVLSDEDIITILQLSVPVAVPKALLISCPTGLHKNKAVPVALIVGGCISLVKVTVCDADAELPHPSVTVQIFVAVKVHPEPGTSAPTVPAAIKPVLQLSVTVAAPNAALICAGDGLHGTDVVVPKEIVGTCVSLVNVIVCDAVPVFPHASVVVHVFVTEREQPDPVLWTDRSCCC
jgi:hypothetical protein